MPLSEHPYIIIGIISLVLGLGAGFVMHRSDFCLAGMFRDVFLFRQTTMIKSFVLLVVSSIVLFEAARQTGLLRTYPFPLLYPATAANLIGGFLFGIGMVLAGGCVVGTLYKMGAGSVLSFAAFLGLLFGSGLYAEFHPAWSAFAKKTVLFPGKITMAQILGINPLFPVLVAAIPGAFILFQWHKQGKLHRPAFASGYLQPSKAALALSLIGALSYALIGMPLGVTSTYTKIAGFIESILFPRHYAELAFYKTMPLKYSHALTGNMLTGGPGPALDALAAIQAPLIIGIVFGSALSAALLRELHVHYRVPWRQYVVAAAGGTIMGLASRMAPTCNVWHLLGGLPLLAASSILFLVGLLPGAWLGGRILVKLLANNRENSTPGRIHGNR
jgi:uncharacterized membrane protein YedE/YeeE